MPARALKVTSKALAEANAWRWGFLATAAACVALFLANVALWDVHPGTPLGMSYGIAATFLLVTSALLGARRRSLRLATRAKLGRSRSWLYLHVYGGALFLLLVLMHSGFRLPVGTLNWWVFLLSLWTVASGAAGLMLQKWIPRVLASGLSIEVNYERIPELIDEIRERAARLAETCDSSVRALYKKRVAPALERPTRDPIFFFDPTGGIQTRLKAFRYLGGRLPAGEREKLAELERLYRAKLEIDAHYTLQLALRGWLWVHVPPTLLLLALVALHVFTVLYY